jgi:hypothetical protein
VRARVVRRPSGGGANATDPGDAAVPAARCDRPALYDVSSPTAVVGDGTPGSCTATALQQAATGGGTIVFRCGAAPVTLTVGFGALGDHGGGEETLVPAAGSPARGIAHDCPPTDQRGKPRAEPCTAGPPSRISDARGGVTADTGTPP